MTTLQILGIVIPIAIILSSFIYSVIKVGKGKGEEPVPDWEAALFFISTLALGFSLGTLV